MDSLTRRALSGTLKFQLLVALMIFPPALTLNYWQGWLFWAVFFACTLATTLYFVRHDPALVARRMRAGPTAEKQTSQKFIQTFAALFVAAIVILSALDHHFNWSVVPWPVVLLGDAAVVASFAIIFVVFRENSFAASTIQIADGQRVISTGPYAFVRHPMYAGAIPMIFGMPLALGSWWGLLPAFGLLAVVIWRLLDEEEYLARTLPGYADYQRRLRWRLLPLLW
jgi:protein-S-isoprenylcysteine O-methyltransferase Ste14